MGATNDIDRKLRLHPTDESGGTGGTLVMDDKTARPISRMGTSVGDGWRESS